MEELFIVLLVLIIILLCWQIQKIRHTLDQELTKNWKLNSVASEYRDYIDYIDGTILLMDDKERYILTFEEYNKMIKQ